MHIKRYEAPSMDEALRRVRAELGPDALVLSTRHVRRGGRLFGRLARPVVEVTAAVDREQRRESEAEAAGGSAARGRPDPSWRALGLARALVEPLEEELRALRRSVDAFGADPSNASIADEVAALRRLAERGGAPASGGAFEAGGPAAPFLAAGLAPRHAWSLGAEAARRAESARGPTRGQLAETLAARLDGRLAAVRGDEPPVTLFAGPTGSGKTTTLAKVAGREARGPSLVSTDLHREGGDAALRGFARRLELPFAAAVSPEDVAEAVRRREGRRVLVDTPGRPRSQAETFGELRALRRALGARARLQLVLPAPHKEADLRAELDRYAALEPEALVVTKVDESAELANVANLLLDERVPPLVWVAHGQRVPEDLEVPEPMELATRVMEAGA